jgi:hypothetical protein
MPSLQQQVPLFKYPFAEQFLVGRCECRYNRINEVSDTDTAIQYYFTAASRNIAGKRLGFH